MTQTEKYNFVFVKIRMAHANIILKLDYFPGFSKHFAQFIKIQKSLCLTFHLQAF